MITRTNIADFYEKYKKNLDREKRLQDSVLKAEDQEVWIENLKHKDKMIRSLYIENEAMLNLYIRPFLEEESRLNNELADEFLQQLLDYEETGYFDDLVCVDVAHILEHFYEKKNDRNALIHLYSLLGKYYFSYLSEDDYKTSLSYFKKVRDYAEEYPDIGEWSVRKRILFSFYNCCAVMMNRNHKKEDQKEILKQLDLAVAFFDDPGVRALDGERGALDQLKKELLNDVFGSWICSTFHKEEIENEFMKRAESVLEKLYQEICRKNDNIYEMEDEIYCNYLKIRYLSGKISSEQYLTDAMEYCDYVLAHDTMDVNRDFYNGRYYQVCMNQVPNLMILLTDKNLKIENREEKRIYYTNLFFEFIEELPHFKNASYVNASIRNILGNILNYLPTGTLDFHFIMSVIINRDEATMLHAEIVRRVALIVLHHIMETKPELLVTLLDTHSVVEVLEKREEFEQYVSEAAMVFDIGKTAFTDIIEKQTRKLSEREMNRIYMHPDVGYEMVKNMESMQPYLDIIRGHHKSYDGISGYPSSFDHTTSPVRFLIELIKICDCMDVVMDDMGRSYSKTKTMDELLEELELGAGQVYNPDIVQLLKQDEALQKEISYLCNAGRIRVYYEVYQDFLQEDMNDSMENEGKTCEEWNHIYQEQTKLLGDVQEKSREKEQVLMSMAKASLLILLVDLNSDKFKIIHKGHSGLFQNLQEEKCQWFIGDYMKNRMPEESDRKLWSSLQCGNLLDRLYESGGLFEVELKINHGKNFKWIRVQFILAEEINGVASKITIVIQDIDETKRRSEQLQSAIKLSHEQAKQANQAKSLFLSNMSHDIRTPMNAIAGMTKIALMHMDEKERVRKCLEKINVSSNHLLELINEVLDVSKIESGKIELEKEQISLKESIQDMLDMTQEAVEDKRITRSVDLEHFSEEWVYGDKARIQQVFLNLMSNAVKYTNEGGHIHFEARTLSQKYGKYNTYQFIFRDNGIGMKPEFLTKIFEPFTREQNDKTQHIQGTGLGLSITKAIVGLMLGDITVESEPGAGSCFQVIIRLKPLEVQKEKKESARKTELFLDRHYPGNRILLAEDNEINREIAVELLHSIEIEVDEAENGEKAVEIFEKKPENYYQMILMDIQMPVMNGYEAADQIRKIEKQRTSRIPIIALTANVFAEDKNLAIRHGMDDHIGKPVELPKLVETLEQWIK